MSPSSRAALLLPAVAMLAVPLVGCSAQTSGEALPIPSGTTNSGRPTTTRSPSPSNVNTGVLEAIDPCTLLTAQEVSQLGADPGKRKDTSSTRGCQWVVRSTRGVFGVALRPSQGFDEINTGRGTLSDQRVGSHDGKLLKEFDGSGACAIIIKITNSSRVDVNTAANDDTEQACDYTNRVAAFIEPKLPRGE